MGGGLKAMKIAVIAMGVLILLGTAVIVGTVIRRATADKPAASGNPGAAYSTILDEPAGTEIVAITQTRDWFAIQLRGGAPDRLVLVNPATGAIAGRVALAR